MEYIAWILLTFYILVIYGELKEFVTNKQDGAFRYIFMIATCFCTVLLCLDKILS